MEAITRRPDRALLVVIIAVAALVVLALVVVLTRGAAAPLDPSTPAGVVQRYTAAVIEGDEEAAREHLVDEARDGCERLEPGSLDDVRVTLADVDVSIVTTSGGGLFGPSEYREEATFDLERTESGWRIASAPWQLAICAQATP